MVLVLECHILIVFKHSIQNCLMVMWNVLYVGKNDEIKGGGGEIGAYRLGELSL